MRNVRILLWSAVRELMARGGQYAEPFPAGPAYMEGGRARMIRSGLRQRDRSGPDGEPGLARVFNRVSDRHPRMPPSRPS